MKPFFVELNKIKYKLQIFLSSSKLNKNIIKVLYIINKHNNIHYYYIYQYIFNDSKHYISFVLQKGMYCKGIQYTINKSISYKYNSYINLFNYINIFKIYFDGKTLNIKMYDIKKFNSIHLYKINNYV